MNDQTFDVLHKGFEDFVGLDHEGVARLRLFLHVALSGGLTFLLGRMSDALRMAGFLRLIVLVSDLRRLSCRFIRRLISLDFLFSSSNLHAKKSPEILEFSFRQLLFAASTIFTGRARCAATPALLRYQRRFIAVLSFQVEGVDALKRGFIVPS